MAIRLSWRATPTIRRWTSLDETRVVGPRSVWNRASGQLRALVGRYVLAKQKYNMPDTQYISAGIFYAGAGHTRANSAREASSSGRSRAKLSALGESRNKMVASINRIAPAVPAAPLSECEAVLTASL